MNPTRLTIFVILLASCALCGCAPSRRPSPAQVDDFINRRAFVISAVNDIKDPMPGTSYSGISERYAAISADRIQRELEASGVSIRGIREEIERHGLCVLPPGLGLEFDVDLSEQLVKDTDLGLVAQRLNHYYGRKLEQAGWYVCQVCKGDTSRVALNCTYMWTDMGKGFHTYSQNSMTVSSSMRDPEDYRRGFFHVLIAVRIDTDVKRAHVTINHWGRIG